MHDSTVSMRRVWADLFLEEMRKNENIYLIVGDLGYKVFDEHFATFPERCINVGAAEQAMVGIAVGLSLSGKLPFCYTISSFYLRAAETIALYLHGEQLNIKLVGSGRGKDYAHDGPSHDATILENFLQTLDIAMYFPQDNKECAFLMQDMMVREKPMFISLRR